MSSIPDQAPAFAHWLDEVLAAYYRWHPVNATFIGMHQHDDLLPDLSEQGLDDVGAEAASFLGRLSALPDESLNSTQIIDRRLAAGMLAIEDWEHRGDHMWRGNPSLAIGEAIFGVMSLFLRDFAPLPRRVEAAIARLHAIPELLQQVQTTIHSAPAAWTQRAIRECDGTLAFLSNGIDLLMAEKGIADSRLRSAADHAAKAVTGFHTFLNGELLASQIEMVGCGEETLDLLIRQGHQLDRSASQIEEQAWNTLHQTDEGLTKLAMELGSADWRDALDRLANNHPTTETYEHRYREVWEEAHDEAIEHDLLTWPDYPIRYVPRPRWTRQAAPYLYFLFYRAPSAFDPVSVVDYLIAPFDTEAPAPEQERFLRANNESMIKLNHVVHHGGIGHQVQNWHAYRAESHIGRIAAVDCASRIAMLCGGTMAEGWACYASELMEETGFYTPLERLSLAHTRLRMAARAIVDVQLHSGRMTLDEAARFYQERTAMTPDAAQQEAVKNSMFPGAALMYLAGTDEIWQLRRDLERIEGSDFSLRRFHDTFLSYGSIPVSVIADSMTATTGI